MNPNKPFNPDALLDDYLDGLLSDAEIAAFEAHLLTSDALKDDFETALMLQSAWKTMPTYKAPAAIRNEVMRRVETDIQEKRWMVWQNRLNSLLFPGWKPAFAAAACVFAIGLWQMRTPEIIYTHPTTLTKVEPQIKSPTNVSAPNLAADTPIHTQTPITENSTPTINPVSTPTIQEEAHSPVQIAAYAPKNRDIASYQEPEYSEAEIAEAAQQLQTVLGYVGQKQNESLELSGEIIESGVAIPMAETLSLK